MNDNDYLFGKYLNIAARLLRAEMAAEMHSQGLTDTVYIVLRTLDDAANRGKPSLTAADLVSELSLSAESVDGAIDRGVRDGFLIQLDSETRLVTLSDKGRTILPGITDTATWTIRQALSGLSDEEVDQLNRSLQQIISNLR